MARPPGPDRNQQVEPPATPGDARIGAVLDNRYRIVSHVAAGSMGRIYKGERLQLGRPVAIKVLQDELASDASFLKRFEVEARALGRLSHPNCVSIIDFGVADAPYLVMDFVHGKTLQDVLKKGGAMHTPRAIHIFRQLMASLAHAHGHGIVHRDVKPGNVMLTEATGTGDHIRILDFGLARLHTAARQDATEERIRNVTGTPFYMSPEQAQGGEGDIRSDLYSAGVLLFELLTGARPFVAEEMLEVLQMQINDAAPALNEVYPDGRFSEELEAVVARALAKDPERRYQTALKLAAAMNAVPEASLPLMRFHGFTAPRPAPPTPGAAPAPVIAPPRVDARPRRAGPLLVIVGSVLLALIALGLWLRQDEPRRTTHRPPDEQANSAPGSAAPGKAAAPLEAKYTTYHPVEGAGRAAAAADGARPRAPRSGGPGTPAPPPAEPTTTAAAAPGPAEPAGPKITPPARARLADVKEMLRAGKVNEAIAALRVICIKNPNNGYVHLLLGQVYFKRRWWSEGIKAYRAAIKARRSYRSNRILNQDLIEALSSDRTSVRAWSMIRTKLGPAALPYLRTAARRHHNPRVRTSAGKLVSLIGRR